MVDGPTSQLSLCVRSWLGRIKVRRTVLIFSSCVILFMYMTFSFFRMLNHDGLNTYSVKSGYNGHLSKIHLLNANGFYENPVNFTSLNGTVWNQTDFREIWSHPQLDILHYVSTNTDYRICSIKKIPVTCKKVLVFAANSMR